MPKIQDSQGRVDENSGYTRLFGVPELGALFSRVQATVIRSGNELEHIIEQRTSIPKDLPQEKVFSLCKAKQLKSKQAVFSPNMPKKDKDPGEKADLIYFDPDQKKALVIEIKDGDTFDTKKANGELRSLQAFTQWVANETGYQVDFAFCSFNQLDKSAIITGAKGRFDLEHVMTGKELCELLGVDYEDIIKKRKAEQPENLRFFLSELLDIHEVTELIKTIFRGKNGNN